MSTIIKGSYRIAKVPNVDTGINFIEFTIYGEKSYYGHPSLFSVEASSPLSGPGYVNVFFKDKLIYSYTTDSPTHPSGYENKGEFFRNICSDFSNPMEESDDTNIFITLPD